MLFRFFTFKLLLLPLSQKFHIYYSSLFASWETNSVCRITITSDKNCDNLRVTEMLLMNTHLRSSLGRLQFRILTQKYYNALFGLQAISCQEICTWMLCTLPLCAPLGHRVVIQPHLTPNRQPCSLQPIQVSIFFTHQ